MIEARHCISCRVFVSRDIQFDKKGNPFWICPSCGAVTWDRGWYKYVDQAEATEIVEHRGRRGLFVHKSDKVYVGIDNSTGDAWVEEFPNLIECLKWLADKEDEDDKE